MGGRYTRTKATIVTKIGECTVNSAVWWGVTGICLQAGRRYQLEASGQWFDASVECGPAGYDLSALPAWKRPLFKLTGRFRPLDTGDRWYVLLGKIGPEGRAFEIGTSLQLVSETPGVLYCTVNDLKLAYGNNRGAITLQILAPDP
jgi:hypothetical protein